MSVRQVEYLGESLARYGHTECESESTHSHSNRGKPIYMQDEALIHTIYIIKK